MPLTPVTARLLHQLLASAHNDGVDPVHVAVVVEHGHSALMLHCGDGDVFSPATWQVPTGLLLAPCDTLIDVVRRVTTHTAGLDLDNVTSYLGHHDQHRAGGAILRTFGFTVAVADPTRTRRNALYEHHWIRLNQTSLPLPTTTAASRHFLHLAAGYATQPQHRPPPLAAELRAHAYGQYAAEAGCDLLINHATWLHRNDFRDEFVHTGLDFLNEPTAYIDWEAAIAALDTGHLPCSGGESRVLRLAASLAHGAPVNLADAVTGLDRTNIDLVVQAVLHAAGQRPA